MKQKLVSVLILLCLCLSLTVTAFAAAGGYVADEAELLSQSEYDAVCRQSAEVADAYDIDICIVTLNDLEGANIDTLVRDLYDSLELGADNDGSGVLLLISMDVREFRIHVRGRADEAMGDELDSITDAITPELRDGDYAGAFETFLDECEQYMDSFVNGDAFEWGNHILIAVIIGLIVGLIVALILKAQLKSVRRADTANMYMKPGSMNLRVQNDFFLYRNVTRTPRPKSNGSGSGSRSRSSGRTGGGSF